MTVAAASVVSPLQKKVVDVLRGAGALVDVVRAWVEHDTLPEGPIESKYAHQRDTVKGAAKEVGPRAPRAKPPAPPNVPEVGVKADAEKPRWDLLPLDQLAGAVDVLTYGAVKYAPENWRKVPDGRDRYYAAMLRHLVAWKGGEELDPESGLAHLDHALCCLMFLRAFA